MPTTSAAPSPGPTSVRRARTRLLAVVLLGVLAALYVALAVRLYFFPSFDAVISGLFGVFLALVAGAYLLLTRAVVRQSRVGHVLAIVVCAVAAVLGLTVDMSWLDWGVLAANVVAFVLLLGCVPRRRDAA
ncbi:MAG: hypothetical protein QM779_12380 [Propionicimonas sp.]|uniref:hypothetical protein n=1 Tax=Propionicimonas sp. TaxID=1955623 RepID=UPI003D10150B